MVDPSKAVVECKTQHLNHVPGSKSVMEFLSISKPRGELHFNFLELFENSEQPSAVITTTDMLKTMIDIKITEDIHIRHHEKNK